LKAQWKSHVISSNAFIPFNQALKDIAEVDVDLGTSSYSRSHLIKKFTQIRREGVFKARWKGFTGEFLLHGNGSLFPPNCELLDDISKIPAGMTYGDSYCRNSQKHDHELFLGEDRVPDKRIHKACQTSSSFLNESAISCQMPSVN
jgi:hypothetical protein